MRSRCGWLLLFFGGLVLAAIVVEAFEEVLKQHVQLSYFGERGYCTYFGSYFGERLL